MIDDWRAGKWYTKLVFTGLVEDIGTVARADRRSDALVLVVRPAAIDVGSLAIGESICHDGVCLTVTEAGGGTFTVDLSAARDNNWIASTDCGDQGGRDVFYQFTLPAEEVVYFDTFGSNFDTVVRIFAGACTSLGTLSGCADDACATTRSQGAIDLVAGTYCLVVDQFSNAATTGATTLTFRRGGRAGAKLPNASGSVAGTTIGKANLSTASCEANTLRPDSAHFTMTCPGANTISANTCSGTAWDTVIYLRRGAATASDTTCADDNCSLQSRITNASMSGANLLWLIVDGYGMTGEGAYTLGYTIQ